MIILTTLVLLIAILVNPINLIAQNNNIRINKRQKSELKKIKKQLDQLNNDKPVSLELKTSQENLTTEGNDINIEYKLKSKKISYKHKIKGNIDIKVVKNEKFDSVDVIDNKIIYSGENSNFDSIIESVSGGVRQIINIKSIDAPSFYDFDMDLTNDEKLVMNQDGSAVIQLSNGDIKMLILAPWAKDADNKDLKTWYEIVNNSTLRQHIDFTNAKFPIKADPTWCGDVIYQVYWAFSTVYKEKKKRSLHVVPTWCGRVSGNLTPLNGILGAAKIASHAWQELLTKTPLAPEWNKQPNTSLFWSMHDQFICHYINPAASIKDIWRMDPWRPNKGLVQTYIDLCNS